MEFNPIYFGKTYFINKLSSCLILLFTNFVENKIFFDSFYSCRKSEKLIESILFGKTEGY